MNATIFDIQRLSVHDGPGIRTTVFMKGCNLRCVWCHNPEGLDGGIIARFFAAECIGCGSCGGNRSLDNVDVCPAEAIRPSGRVVTADELMTELLRDRAFYSTDGGVTFSGGECLLQSDFVAEVCARLHREGVSTAIDTAGLVPWESIAKTLPVCDLYLYDVKCADTALHRRFTGVSNDRILENLRRLSSAGAKIWIRIPVIPDFNDNMAELSRVAGIVASLDRVDAVALMPYHSLGVSKYETLGMTPPYTTEKQIEKADLDVFKAIFTRKGLKVL